MKKSKTKKKKLNRKKQRIIVLIILLLVLLVLLFRLELYNKEPIILKYSYSENYNEDKTLDVSVKLQTFNMNKVYCKFISDEESKWVLAKGNTCTYPIKTGNYTIKIRYNKDMLVEYKKSFNIDKVISIKMNDNRRYVAVGGNFNVNAVVDYVGDVDTSVTYSSSNPDIVSIDENGNVHANADGDVVISAKTSNGLEDKFDLTSTSLIRPRRLDNYKSTVGCNVYTKEQVELLDAILKYEVDRAGPGTRAGVVAAATFLPLEFPYKIPYFYENGRLTQNGDHKIVDGEGRWYHKGLYLGVDKQNEVTQRMNGPRSWGCSLINWEDDGHRKPGEYYPNGLDCSGYVSWVLYNGGLDPGDIGAGITDWQDDMTDLGELRYINYDLMHSGLVKPGDLTGWDGHTAVIAWMTDTKIYVTESLLPGVVLDEYDYSSPYSNFYRRYDYVIDMSNQYSGEGNYPIIFE